MRLPARFLLCAIAAAPVAAQTAPLPLIPLPRDVVVRGARIPLVNGVAITHADGADDAFTARDLAESFAERRIRADTTTGAGRYRVELLRLNSVRAQQLLRERRLIFDTAMTAEGYVLLADSTATRIIGAGAN